MWIHVSIASIRSDVILNLVQWTFPSDNQYNFRETAGSIFSECAIDGDEPDMAVTDMTR